MSVIHGTKEPELDGRHLLFPLVLLLCFGALLARLWYLQVIVGPELAKKARALAMVSVEKLAPRGLIFDRNGKQLAGIRSKLVVMAVPAEIDKNPWVIERLATMLDVPKEKLQDAVEDARWRRYFPAPIHVGIPIEAASRIAEAGDDLPGITVETQPMRYYADYHAFAHLLGYVWTPNEKDEARLKSLGIDPPAYVGKAGLEAQYDAELMGKPGSERFEVNAKRVPSRLVGRDNAVPGVQLTLTIDADLHKFALGLLKGRKGAIVAIDPSTGEVLCMASSPSYNVEAFGRGIRQAEFDALRDDPAFPLINRAFDVNAQYSPGSTFKPLTAIAAMQAGVFDPGRTVNCPGYFKLGTRRIACLGRHGDISFERAMAASCNTYFSDLALRAGPDALRRAATEAGLGEKTGIDLRGEGKGIVPTMEWIRRWRPDGKWYPGDTANMGLGQGEIAVTPLQMAGVAALIANRGVAFRPYLVKSKTVLGAGLSEAPAEKRILGRIDLSDESWNILQSAMIQVVESGSARVAKISGLTWAGKTGSPEKRGQNRTDSWFIGYAPAIEPKIAVAVMAEDIGHGAEFAAPVAREVVKRYLLNASKRSAKSFAATSSSLKPAALPARR